MSIGELLNLYRDDELIIHPEFQRLFRWKELQKTRFIESLLLGIPVPPIFVFQDRNGAWELIDGLQRLSTIFEFVGVLKGRAGELGPAGPTMLLGTNFLPDLAGRAWDPSDSYQGIGKTAQISIKRARIRVEILKKESDPIAKYELFQRLNTGGTSLTEQEVRNCTALMINPAFSRWLTSRSENPDFKATTAQTEEALRKQAGVELVLRFLSFRSVPYKQGLDVHEYLDKSLITLASDQSFPFESEEVVFERTFAVLNSALGEDAFKRWDGQRFTGKFLMSLFEVVALGASRNINDIERQPKPTLFLTERAKALWSDETFQKNSGAGVRGTTRLAKLLPMADLFFKP
ncbi:MAG TPA: DUF262 domain-containing protein [Edaphobacter sp.]|nr:DUF262 domain-containing protein [Edaphobacter sp.]